MTGTSTRVLLTHNMRSQESDREFSIKETVEALLRLSCAAFEKTLVSVALQKFLITHFIKGRPPRQHIGNARHRRIPYRVVLAPFCEDAPSPSARLDPRMHAGMHAWAHHASRTCNGTPTRSGECPQWRTHGLPAPQRRWSQYVRPSTRFVPPRAGVVGPIPVPFHAGTEPHLRRDRATSAPGPSHICAGTEPRPSLGLCSEALPARPVPQTRRAILGRPVGRRRARAAAVGVVRGRAAAAHDH